MARAAAPRPSGGQFGETRRSWPMILFAPASEGRTLAIRDFTLALADLIARANGAAPLANVSTAFRRGRRTGAGCTLASAVAAGSDAAETVAGGASGGCGGSKAGSTGAPISARAAVSIGADGSRVVGENGKGTAGSD